MLSELPKGLRTPLYKLLLGLNMTAEFLCILLLVFNHTLVAMLCLNLIWWTINPNIFFSFVFALDNYFFVAYSDWTLFLHIHFLLPLLSWVKCTTSFSLVSCHSLSASAATCARLLPMKKSVSTPSPLTGDTYSCTPSFHIQRPKL